MDATRMHPVLLAPRASATSKPASNSVSGMVSTLIPALIIAIVLVSLFLVIRVKFRRIYSPRTYLGSLSEHQKTPRPSESKFGWIKDFMRLEDAYVLNHHSLDAYLLLRFWRTITFICVAGILPTWIILMPVYGTSHAGQKEFDKISYSNIRSSTDSARLYAVVLVAILFLGGIMFIIGRESIHCVQLKQAFMRLPGISSRLASRTVLFTNVPTEYLNEQRLRETFPAVQSVWICTNTSELEDLIKDRDKTAMKLEGAEIKLSKMAIDKRLKDKKAQEKKGASPAVDPVQFADSKRPTHKLKFLIGKKVDTIDWSRSHLREVVPQVEKQQATHWAREATLSSAVFIEFSSIQAAQGAFHKTSVQVPSTFESREVGTRPQEIIWKNLNMSKSQRRIRTIVVIAIICFLIIMWVPIVAFIGSLANINSLTNKVAFLSFIKKIPGPLLGIVTGLLPVILLAVLMALVPIIMRLLFKLAGCSSLAAVELKTQTWYFVFQVIQVFLITTIASGASAAVTQIISDPSSAGTLLASSLPKASNFYIDFFVLYGLAVASKQIFNIVAVLLYVILGKFLDNTPRKMFKRYTVIASIGWGSIYPVYTNLAVIAITYSCIAPLILGFAAISFFLLYIAFRYQMMYSVDTLTINTQGRSYAKALNQLTTGVYLSEICLIGLFGISSSASAVAAGALVLMVIFLVITVIYHILLNRTVASLEKTVSREVEQAPEYGEEMTLLDADNKVIAPTPVTNTNTKAAGFLVKLLRPPPLPRFEPYLSTPMPKYSDEIRRQAYVNPAITSPTPLLWIVRDDMGISQREMEATGQVVGITDEDAWWDQATGKLTTGWVGALELRSENPAKEAPIWEENVPY